MEPLQCHVLVFVEWEGVATVQQHRSWVLSARVCKAGRHGTHHLHWVGFGCTVELEGADAAVRWWESSVQCGETARCVMCMGEVARGVCRSIPPQSFLMLSRQGIAQLLRCTRYTLDREELWTMVVYRYLCIGHEQRETFLTVDFFEHETQATSVVAGLTPAYDMRLQYVCKVDSFFLQVRSTPSTQCLGVRRTGLMRSPHHPRRTVADLHRTASMPTHDSTPHCARLTHPGACACMRSTSARRRCAWSCAVPADSTSPRWA